jgi:hypothetical protein
LRPEEVIAVGGGEALSSGASPADCSIFIRNLLTATERLPS